MTNTLNAYFTLCKPRVVALMLLTAIVGMLLARPTNIPWLIFSMAITGIALTAGAAATLNHLIDRHFDSKMGRTNKRPIPTGAIKPSHAIIFALLLASIGMTLIVSYVNIITAILTLATLFGYAFIYTIFLKHATPQNIVIGGLAGATPPLLGWTAMTGQFDPNSLLLVLIIFVWTPPHFWALAIYRYDDYAKAGIPMLPVTHGIRFTKLSIFLYTILLCVVSILPFVFGMSHWFYLSSTLLLNAGFLYWAIKLLLNDEMIIAVKTFRYSIIYLMLLFIALLVDRYIGLA